MVDELRVEGSCQYLLNSSSIACCLSMRLQDMEFADME